MADDTMWCERLDGKCLVFGLDWLPLLGGHTRKQAMAKARRYRATHCVTPSEHAAAMGLIQFPRSEALRHEPYYAAAQIVAGMYPSGTVAVSIAIQPGRYWLVAVHEGAVIARTDILLGSAQQITNLIDELRLAYAHIRHLDAAQGKPNAPGLGALAGAADDRALLWQIPGRWAPKGLSAFVVVVCVVAGGGALVAGAAGRWLSGQAAPGPLSAQATMQAWVSARSAATASVLVHGVDGMQQLLLSLYRVPVQVSGWRVVSVLCKPLSSTWRCTAFLRRRSRHANNQRLMASAPHGWALRFLSVDDVEADWTVTRAATPLSEAVLNDGRWGDKYWLSSLQHISRAFVTLKASPAVAHKFPAPVDAQGVMLPRPEGFRAYQVRSLQVDGPLRSYSLLLPNLTGVRWQQVALTFKNLERPTLQQSQLHLSAKGERYEWQS